MVITGKGKQCEMREEKVLFRYDSSFMSAPPDVSSATIHWSGNRFFFRDLVLPDSPVLSEELFWEAPLQAFWLNDHICKAALRISVFPNCWEWFNSYLLWPKCRWGVQRTAGSRSTDGGRDCVSAPLQCLECRLASPVGHRYSVTVTWP